MISKSKSTGQVRALRANREKHLAAGKWALIHRKSSDFAKMGPFAGVDLNQTNALFCALGANEVQSNLSPSLEASFSRPLGSP